MTSFYPATDPIFPEKESLWKKKIIFSHNFFTESMLKNGFVGIFSKKDFKHAKCKFVQCNDYFILFKDVLLFFGSKEGEIPTNLSKEEVVKSILNAIYVFKIHCVIDDIVIPYNLENSHFMDFIKEIITKKNTTKKYGYKKITFDSFEVYNSRFSNSNLLVVSVRYYIRCILPEIGMIFSGTVKACYPEDNNIIADYNDIPCQVIIKSEILKEIGDVISFKITKTHFSLNDNQFYTVGIIEH